MKFKCQQTMDQAILLTGCAGFIGSNFVPYFLKKYEDYKIINLDLLTYAGNLEILPLALLSAKLNNHPLQEGGLV
jgi:dTDP-glucose 4,6-dehydratase